MQEKRVSAPELIRTFLDILFEAGATVFRKINSRGIEMD